MIKRIRLGILAIVLGVMLVHFSMVGLYVNPLQTGQVKNFWAEWYAYPFFSQGWNLFVPVPANNYYVYCDYQVNGQHVQEEVFQSLIARHQKNRLLGLEPTIVGLTNCIHYFHYSAGNTTSSIVHVKDNLNFRIFSKMVRSLLESRQGRPLEKLRIMLLIKPVSGKEQQVFFSDVSLS